MGIFSPETEMYASFQKYMTVEIYFPIDDLFRRRCILVFVPVFENPYHITVQLIYVIGKILQITYFVIGYFHFENISMFHYDSFGSHFMLF